MFDKQYRFTGTHAIKAKDLRNPFNKDYNMKIFERGLDILVNAPLIGFLYSKNVPENRQKDQNGNVVEDSVFLEQVMNEKAAQTFNFQLIMLLDTDYEPNPKKREDSAFRYYNRDLTDNSEILSEENRARKERTIKDLDHYYGYLRGGIDILHEKLIEGCGSEEDFIEHLIDFILDFNERYNEEIDKDELEKRCLTS